MIWLARGIALASLLAGGVYLAMISGQGNEMGLPTVLVLALIVVPGLAGYMGALVAPAGWRGLLLGWCAFGLLAITVLSAASVGFAVLPLAIAAVALMVVRLRREGRPVDMIGAVAGGALGIGLTAAYLLSLPYLPPQCPSGATASGTSVYPAGSIYGSQEVDVSWRCDRGRLVSWSHTP